MRIFFGITSVILIFKSAKNTFENRLSELFRRKTTITNVFGKPKMAQLSKAFRMKTQRTKLLGNQTNSTPWQTKGCSRVCFQYNGLEFDRSFWKYSFLKICLQ